jgi:cytidylate kinase
LRKIAIAIDGPAASGKSTTAKLVAQRLGYVHLDTGAMYRAVTYGILKRGIDASSKDKVESFASTATVVVEADGTEGNRIFLNGENVTQEIRSPIVTRNVSAVSSYQGVRSVLVREQRKLSAQGGVVLEGRDIGTVVLPNAELKIYMVANVAERARRRKKDLLAAGVEVDEEELVKEIEERDRKDSTREASPLRMAPDAVRLDTSDITIEQQVSIIIDRAREIIGAGEEK